MREIVLADFGEYQVVQKEKSNLSDIDLIEIRRSNENMINPVVFDNEEKTERKQIKINDDTSAYMTVGFVVMVIICLIFYWVCFGY